MAGDDTKYSIIPDDSDSVVSSSSQITDMYKLLRGSDEPKGKKRGKKKKKRKREKALDYFFKKKKRGRKNQRSSLSRNLNNGLLKKRLIQA
jgi:hypothetical protein